MPTSRRSQLTRRRRPASHARRRLLQVQQLETRAMMAVYTWTNGAGAGDVTWSNPLNWSMSGVDSGGIGGVPDTLGDSAVFAGAGAGNVNVNIPVATDSLTFTTAIANYTLSGSDISLKAGGTLTQNVAVSNTINSKLIGTGINASIAAGTLRLGNVANTLDATSSFQVDGTLVAAGNTTSALGSANVALNNGTLTMDGVSAAPGTGLLGQYYNIAPQNISNSNPDVASLAALSRYLSVNTAAVSSTTNINYSNGGDNALDNSNAAFSGVFANNGYGGGAAFSAAGFGNTDNLVAVWRGKVDLPAGVSRFATRSDDGNMVYIDGNLVVNSNFFQGATTRTGDTPNFATAGQHDIVVVFYEGGGGAGIQVGYTPAGGSAQIIPATALSPALTNMTYTNSVTVNGNSTINANNTETLTLGNLNTSGGATLNANSASAAELRFSGTTSLAAGTTTVNTNTPLRLNGPVIGSGDLTKSGENLLYLSGANTYTGVTTIANGTVVLGNNAALGAEGGASSRTIIQPGATLDIRGFRAGASGNEFIEVAGAGFSGVGAIINNGGDQTSAFRQITLLGDTTFSGTGRWDMRDTGGASTLTMNGYTITKIGGREVALLNTSIASPGNITINAGLFRFEGSTTFNGAGRTITINNGTTLDFWANNNTHTANITVNSGTISAQGGGSPTLLGTVNMVGGTTISAGTNGGTSNFTIGSQLLGAGTFSKTGGGTLTLTNATNSYTSITTVNDGVLRVTDSNALGAAGAAQGTNVVSGSLEISGSIALNEPLMLTGAGNASRGAIFSSSGSPTLGGLVTVVGNTTIGNTAAGTTFNINSTLTKAGAADITFAGAGDINVTSGIADNLQISNMVSRLLMSTGLGVTTLPGANNIAFVNAPAVTRTLSSQLIFPQDSDGRLSVFFGGQPGGSPFTAAFVGDLSITTAGTYYFAASNNDDTASVWIDVNRSGSFDAGEMIQSGTCCNSSNVGSVALTPGAPYKIAYLVEDTGGGSGIVGRAQGASLIAPTNSNLMPIVDPSVRNSVIKTGGGTLILAGANTYGGDTQINQGTIRLSGGSDRLPVGTNLILNGGTLDLNNQNQTIAGLTDYFSTNNNAIIDSTNDGVVPTLTVNVVSGENVFSGVLGGGASNNGFGLTKTGAGTLTLLSGNTYTGPTNIAFGTLKLGVSPTGPSTTNLDVWLDANDSSTFVLNGSTISQWNDKSGNERNLTNTSAANQPTAVTNVLNGKQVVRFDGNDGLSNTYNPGAPYTIVTMSKMTGGQNARLISSKSNNWLLGYHGGRKDVGYAEGWVTPDSGNAASPVADTMPHIYTARGTGSITTFLEGGRVIASNNNGLAAPNGLSLGGASSNNNAGSEASRGDVAEVLWYSGVLSPAEYAAALRYLSGKWLVNLTGQLPDASPVTVASGASLDLNGVSDTIGSLAGAGLVTSGAVGAITLTVGADNTTNANFAGTLQDGSGTVSLAKTGTGTQLLSGTGTYSGTTTVSQGTLQLGSASALGSTSAGTTVASGAVLDLNGQAIGSENVTLNGSGIGGNGALVNSSVTPASLAGNLANTTYSIGGVGNITLTGNNQGNLTKVGNNLVSLAGAGDNGGLVATVNGGVLELAKASNAGVHAIGGGSTSLTINSGGTVRLAGAGGDQLYFQADVQVNSGGLFDLNGQSEGIDGLNGAGTITNSTATLSTLTVGNANTGGTFSGTISGLLALTKGGSGTLVLSGANSYSGATNVAAGTLQLGSSSALGATAAGTTVQSGAVLNLNGQAIGNEPVTLNGSGIGGNGALINSSATPASLAGNLANTSYTIGGTGNITLTGNNQGNLTKVGGNTVSLAGGGDNGGLVATVNAGVLELSKSSNGGVHAIGGGGTSLTINNGGTVRLAGTGGDQIYFQADVLVNAGGLFDLNGQSEGIDGLNGNGNVTNSSATLATLTLGEANANGTFGGSITGLLALTKVGSGTLLLNGASTYTGDTLVNAGTLGGNGSLTSNIAIATPATLSPGGTPGTLTTTGNTTLQAGSIYRVELIGTSNDALATNGIDLNNAVLDASSDANLGAGTLFVIIDNTSGAPVNGAFLGLGEGDSFFINGYQYFITYQYNGNDVAIYRNRPVDAIDDQLGPILPNTSISGNTYTNDLDDDGDARSTIIAQPANGKAFMDPATGIFTYTPNANFIGIDTFTYRLSDGEFNDTATVSITVSPVFLVGGVLQVGGTTNADNIIVQNGSVRYNSTTYPLTAQRVVVHGNGGNDTISVTASSIAVEFHGDDGDDYLSGGSLNDILDGGAGTDRLLGNAGEDRLYGGGGSDNLSGGAGNDYLSGDGYLDASSVEQQAADAGKDTLSGDAGDDTIHGGSGMDTLLGGIGNDYLSGGEDGDAVDGGAGHDILLGDGGGDKLYGRAGNDVLIGGEGLDTLLGDTGSDLVYGGNVDSALDEATLRAIALNWFTPATQATAAGQLAGYSQDDLVSDSLNGEADDDWYLLFAKDLIATTERFPGNRKSSL